jgi:two-component sensor histidine kinase
MTADFEKKEAALKLEQAQKDAALIKERSMRDKIMLLLVLVSLIALGVFYNLKKNQSQKRLIESQNKQIKETLLEKETLLREVHHRVKNNLQIVYSLLNIQSRTILDKEALSSIQEGQNRIQAMSLIHQYLYQSEQLSFIDLDIYFRELVEHISKLFVGENTHINTHIDTSGVRFGIDIAIPLGLIVNELVSNSYKYAFELKNKGDIWINIVPLDADNYELRVSDNGQGLPKDVDIHKAKSLGFRLVTILSRQLHGHFSHQSDKDITSIIVVFKSIKIAQNTLE